LPDNRHQHILIDEIIELPGVQSKRKYAGKLNRLYQAKLICKNRLTKMDR